MIAVCALAIAAATPTAVTVDWGTAALTIDERGRMTALTDASTGKNLVPAAYPFCTIKTPKGTQSPLKVTKQGDRISFFFPGGGQIIFQVTTRRGFSLWRVDGLAGIDPNSIETATWCSLPLAGLKTVGGQMNACYGRRFAVAVMTTAINVRGFTGGAQIGGKRCVILNAASYKRHGLLPAGFGIIACPRREFEKTIEAFEKAAGLPSPHPGGVWGKKSPWTRQSYLFITSFGEADTNEVIKWAKRGGFRMILIGGSSWTTSEGHYHINRKRFPDGLAALVRTANRFRKAGLRVGLHFLAAAVRLHDPYVWPKPDPRLVKDAWAELAADIDAKADFIPTTAAPEGFPAEDGGYRGHGTYIQIDDELIHYARLQTKPPFGFGACARGALRTKAAPHSKGAKIAHLRRAYGYFLYDLDSSLADEVISAACRAANAIRADMLYFDGSENLQGEHWYYNAKLQKMYYDHLRNKDALLQGSSYSHFSWHIISRMASADGHGDVKRYLDQRSPNFKYYAANLMPLDIGWYYIYDPKVTEDQFEYILQKCLGFNASISVQTNPANLRTHPAIGTIFDLVRTYEALRLTGKVPGRVRARLRERGREYRLLHNPLRLRRVVYGKWRSVRELDGRQNTWELAPAMDGARLGVQVRCGPLVRPGRAYDSDRALLLEDFRDLAPYLRNPKGRSGVMVVEQPDGGWCKKGVACRLEIVDDGPGGGRCVKYTATSTLADNSGWSAIGRRFDPPLDLSWHKAIGFWLRGDGRGGSFKLQLRDDKYATDYYIRNDFTDWRYFQLPRPTKPQPEPIDYSRVRHLILYYNGLPAGQTVSMWIAGVKALPAMDEAAVVDPALELAARRLVFRATLRHGERLVYFPGERPFITPRTAGPRRPVDVLAGEPIELSGPVRVTFACRSLTAEAEVRLVQDCPETLPLPAVSLDR